MWQLYMAIFISRVDDRQIFHLPHRVKQNQDSPSYHQFLIFFSVLRWDFVFSSLGQNPATVIIARG